MQQLIDYLPLLNFVIVFLIAPIWKLIQNSQKTIEKQQQEIEQLKKIVKQQSEELKLLRAIFFKHLPPDDFKQYMLEIEK